MFGWEAALDAECHHQPHGFLHHRGQPQCRQYSQPANPSRRLGNFYNLSCSDPLQLAILKGTLEQKEDGLVASLLVWKSRLSSFCLVLLVHYFYSNPPTRGPSLILSPARKLCRPVTKACKEWSGWCASDLGRGASRPGAVLGRLVPSHFQEVLQQCCSPNIVGPLQRLQMRGPPGSACLGSWLYRASHFPEPSAAACRALQRCPALQPPAWSRLQPFQPPPRPNIARPGRKMNGNTALARPGAQCRAKILRCSP